MVGGVNVLLVNTNRIRPPIGPLALDYIGSALHAARHSASLLDLCWEPDAPAAIARAFAGPRPDAVAVTFRNTDDCYFSSGHSFVSVLRDDVAAIRRHYDGPLIIGGCGFSVMPELLLDHVRAPFGARGDGEATLPAFLQAVRGRLDLARVPGLVFKSNGRWRRNARASADFAVTRLSHRATIDNARYFRNGGQAGIETKRGCSGRCVYCADPVIKGHRSRQRPPADIVAEIRRLLAQGVDTFHFCDSEFNRPPAHAEAVCRALINARLGGRIRWHTYASPAPMSRARLALMQKAGCAGVNFGVDSGNDRMLRSLGRDFDRADILRTARHCHTLKLTFMLDLLVGAPGETWSTVSDTLDLVRSADPSCAGISLGIRLYPGTPLAGRLSTSATRQTPGLTGNPSGIAPFFFLSPSLGPNPLARIRERVGTDSRFFLPAGKDEKDYNYNGNAVLQRAIDSGKRGAYWDILRNLNSRWDRSRRSGS